MKQNWKKHPLFAVLALAFLLRMIFFIIVIPHPERVVRRDTVTYVTPAENMLADKAFSQPGIECARRTPAYPVFIAFAFTVFGRSLLAVSLVQIFLSVLTVVLVYYLATLYVSRRAGVFAALFFALSLNSIVYSLYVLTETLFTFLFVLIVIALVQFQRNNSWIWILLAACSTACAVLSRPVAQILVLVFALWILFIAQNWRRKMAFAAAYVGIVAVLVLPWMARNARVCGPFTISTISDYNILYTFAASLQADMSGQDEETVRAFYHEKIDSALALPSGEPVASRAARLQRKMGLQIISAHPFRYLQVHLTGTLNSFLPNITDLFEILGYTQGGRGTLAVLNQKGLFAAVRHYFHGQMSLLIFSVPFMIILFLTFIFSAIGVIRFCRSANLATISLLLIPVLLLYLFPGAAAVPRFRAPIMPGISVLAGIGLTWVLGRVAERK